MREIKFRAWDGYKMIMPKDNAYYQHYISMCGSIVQKSSEGMDCFGGGDRWARVELLELMQFTGLQDSEGVDIYEGDVFLPLYNRLPKLAVIYKNGKFNISNFCHAKCKVIGNIHQNPELLGLNK